GSRNISTIAAEALYATVVINENGRRKTVSKLQAAFIQQSNAAASGDPRAVKLMLDIVAAAEQREEARSNGEDVAPEKRRALAANVLASLKARMGGADDE